MASSNTLKDQILALFPDNNNQEISAADLRIFVTAIFDNKEELVVKVNTAADIVSQREFIFEKSILVIEKETINNGIYLSLVNNPISLSQFFKIADTQEGAIGTGNLVSDGSIPMDDGYAPTTPQGIATQQYVTDAVAGATSGNPYPPGTAEYFLFNFNAVNSNSEADYFYDIDGNILSINVFDVDRVLILYIVTFSYNIDEDIDLKTVTDDVGNKVDISFIYTAGILTNKYTLYTAI